MKKLVEYTHCLPGGGMLLITGIRKFDGGLIVLEIRHIPAVVPLAA